MKLRIKQVPDARPNDDGEWIELDATPLEIVVLEDDRNKWDRLSAFCADGFHAVSYEINQGV